MFRFVHFRQSEFYSCSFKANANGFQLFSNQNKLFKIGENSKHEISIQNNCITRNYSNVNFLQNDSINKNAFIRLNKHHLQNFRILATNRFKDHISNLKLHSRYYSKNESNKSNNSSTTKTNSPKNSTNTNSFIGLDTFNLPDKIDREKLLDLRKQLLYSCRFNPTNQRDMLQLSQNYLQDKQYIYSFWVTQCSLLNTGFQNDSSNTKENSPEEQFILSQLHLVHGISLLELGSFQRAEEEFRIYKQLSGNLINNKIEEYLIELNRRKEGLSIFDSLDSKISHNEKEVNSSSINETIQSNQENTSKVIISPHFELPERRNKIDGSVRKNEEYFGYLSNFFPGSKLEIKDTLYAGRGVFATENIKKGEQFYHEHTTFMVNGSFSNDLCSTCGGDLPSNLIVDNEIKFCSKSCHSRGSTWTKHASSNKYTSNPRDFPNRWFGDKKLVWDPTKEDEDGIIPSILQTPTSALSNIPLLMSKIASFTISHENFPCETDALPPFIMLSSLLDRDYDGDYLKHKFNLQRQQMNLDEYVLSLFDIQLDLNLILNPYFDMEWMVNLSSIIMSNAFVTELNTKKHEVKIERDKNLALFPGLASYFNHSCECNAQWSATGNLIVFKALKDIKKGEEVTISYIPQLTHSHLYSSNHSDVKNTTDLPNNIKFTWAQRQTALLRYNFECKCPRCTQEKNLASTIRYAN